MTSAASTTLSLLEISHLFQNAAQDVAVLAHMADNNNPRQKALAIAQSLVARLENPDDVVIRYAWEVPSRYLPPLP